MALTGEGIRFSGEYSGLHRYFDVYAFRANGWPDRHVAVLFADVTQRIRAEQALREADRRKDEFLAMLAHELRNPLAAIRNSVQILLQKAGGRTDRPIGCRNPGPAGGAHGPPG